MDNRGKNVRKMESFRQSTFPMLATFAENRKRLINPHWHDNGFVEFIKVVRGPVDFRVDNHDYHVDTGDILFIEGSRTHSAVSVDRPDKAIRAVVFDRTMYGMNVPEHNYKYGLINPDISWDKFHFNYGMGMNRFLSNLMDQIFVEYEEEKSFYQLAINGLLCEIMAGMLRYFEECNSELYSSGHSISDLHRLDGVFEYIEEKFAEPIKLIDLSHQAHLSPYYFSRFFKEAVGTSPMKYITKYRLNQAIHLIVETSEPIYLIAEKTGFHSMNYFDKVFREEFGFTPSSCR